MTMLDFDSAVLSGTAPIQTQVIPQQQTQVVLREEVRVTPMTSGGYKAKPESEWNWSDLRDYVMSEIELRHGPQVRDVKKEASICKSFISRFGLEKAILIARYSFEIKNGMWRGAPISITRFCKGSDPYFSEVILSNLG